MNIKTPLFSIIIPVYNYGHTIARAVGSVLKQSCPDFEIILVDDGSRDDSAAVCEKLAATDPRIHFISQPNGGAASARNHGIRVAQGEFLVFLDADDELYKDALTQAKAAQERYSANVIIGAHISRHENGVERRHRPGFLPKHPADRIRAYLIDKKIRISNGAIIIQKDIFERGHFPENYRSGEDIPVFAQALCATQVVMLDEPLVVVNKHPDSLRHQSPLSLEQAMQLVEEIFNTRRLPAEALVWKDRYEAQRALSLMRNLYIAGQYTEALSMYVRALRKRPRLVFKWPYTRKALRAIFKPGVWRALSGRLGFKVRNNDWVEIEAGRYAEAWASWGGSFILHPEVTRIVSAIAGEPLQYFGCLQGGELVAAVPVWGRKSIAGNRKYLREVGKKNQLDTGDNEMIFPLKPGAKIELPFRARFISALQAPQIDNVVREKDFEVALARSHVEGENKLARKFKYNQKRALRLFVEAGGEVCPVASLTPAVIAQSYIELFESRWGFPAPGKARLQELVSGLHSYLLGSALKMNGRIIAIQLVFMVESKNYFSAAYINGGYDPAYREHSPGSILCYLNTEAAENTAIAAGKSLRYHFGKLDADYKRMWCYPEKTYRI